MSQPSDTPETDLRVEHVTSTSFRGFIVSPNFARELERQRDAAREDARRLAQVVKALQIYADDGEGGNYASKALTAHEALTAKN